MVLCPSLEPFKSFLRAPLQVLFVLMLLTASWQHFAMVSLWFLPLRVPPKEYLDVKWIISLSSIHSTTSFVQFLYWWNRCFFLSTEIFLGPCVVAGFIWIRLSLPSRQGCCHPTIPELAKHTQSLEPGQLQVHTAGSGQHPHDRQICQSSLDLWDHIKS